MKLDFNYREIERIDMAGAPEIVIMGQVFDDDETRKFIVNKVNDMRVVVSRFYSEKSNRRN